MVLRARLDDGARVFFGYAKNISGSGIFIATVNPRAVGEQFDIELTLPAPCGLRIAGRCEVVWRRPYSARSDLDPGMGLRFLDLPAEVAAALGSWVEGADESKD